MNRLLVALAFSFFTIPALAEAQCGCATQPACQTCCPTTTCRTCCKCVPQKTYTMTCKTVSRLRLVRTCEQRTCVDRCGCCRTRNVSRLRLVRECKQVPVCKVSTTYRRVCTTQCSTSCCDPCRTGGRRMRLFRRR